MVPNCTSHGCPIEDVILTYARENLVMFNIFIKDPYAKRFQKDEKITKTSYIANSGGLLGLCMGFSLISGAEILFHCFFGFWSAIFPSEKKKLRIKNSKLTPNQLNQFRTSHHQHQYVQHCCPQAQHNAKNNTTAENISDYNHQLSNNCRTTQQDSAPPHYDSAVSSEKQNNCCNTCNFHHIVQLQDGTTRSVLCTNLNLTPTQLRNELTFGVRHTTCASVTGNGSCGQQQQQHHHHHQQQQQQQNNSLNHIQHSESSNKGFTGPERII
jgi:hypothetical protein